MLVMAEQQAEAPGQGAQQAVGADYE
jgi:hypothetical protein